MTVACATIPAGATGADAATATTVAAATTPRYASSVVDAVRSEADWIATAQMTDGAIAHYTDHTKIWPYLSNFAAIGLARATAVTGDRTYVGRAWRWLAWYRDHEDASGFVTDYDIVGGVPVSTGDMDSTDAYAGTYLLATWSAWQVDQNKATLKGLVPGINGAVRAIAATTDADHLTWAKPSWHVKYLMDEAETYAGLRAAAKLYAALGATRASKNAATRAANMRSAVTALWNDPLTSFDWAVHADGAHQTTDWTKLYSDSLEQAWAVAFGVVDSTKAVVLTDKLEATHPLWSDPTSVGQPDNVDYWPVAGWAFDRAGSIAVALSAASDMQSVEASTSRAWPYTPAVAGQLIVLLTGGPNLP